MERLTLRHLSGGFVGGTLGILTFSLLGSWFMPIGCLFGVLIGFYPDMISREIKKGWLNSIFWLKNLEISRPSFHTPAFRMPHFKKAKLYLAYCVWKDSKDDHLYHPMNRAYKIVTWASIVFFIPLIVSIVILIMLYNSLGEMAWLTVAWVFIALISFIRCGGIWSGFYGNREKPERFSLAKYYRRYEIYSKYGGFGLFLYQIYTYSKIETVTLMAFISVILYWPVLAPFFICLMGVLWVVAYTFKAIYHISKRRDHWICLAIVLTITPITAYLLRHHMSEQILWLSSLGNGILCALLSESVRCLVVFGFDKQVNFRTWVTSNIESDLGNRLNVFKDHYAFGFDLIEKKVSPY